MLIDDLAMDEDFLSDRLDIFGACAGLPALPHVSVDGSPVPSFTADEFVAWAKDKELLLKALTGKTFLEAEAMLDGLWERMVSPKLKATSSTEMLTYLVM